MTAAPATRYVKSGEAYIAYQVVGDGPVDLVVVRGYISHVETAWESPALSSFYRRLTSFCRLILFDKRGTGLSDRVPEHHLPTLEQRMDDMRAVMDAAGSEKAALFASSEGGPMCVLFAATYPERTRALVLWGCFARYDWRQSFIGRYWGDRSVDDALARLEREWGDGGDLESMAPSLAADEAARRAWGRAQRLAATPGTARALLRMMLDIDVCPILPSVGVPTLVLQRAGDVAVDASHSRYLAEHIPGAKYVELPGRDHLFWVGDVEPVVAEVQSLLTGVRPATQADRLVTTVVFVDASPGPAGAEVERFRGRALAPSIGPTLGFTFDGPARAIQCATAIVERDRTARAGVHTGECSVRDGAVEGVAVELAREIFSLAAPGEVLVSRTVVDLVAGSGLAFDPRGARTLASAPGEWQLASVSQTELGARPPPVPSRAGGVFRRDGDLWLAEFRGTSVRLRPAKGLEHLARLLAEPGREIHALELAGARGNDGFRETELGPILDESAKHAYRSRVRELRELVDAAEANGDAAEAEAAKTELDALARQLSAALGLGGRGRPGYSAAERARQAVAKAIRIAIDRIAVQHPRLGEHLAATIHTGTFCRYQPLEPAEWVTGGTSES